MATQYIVKKKDIDAYEGTAKQHFLNEKARRVNKSLGDLTGLTGLGVHLIEVPPGCESTEYHCHYYEDECVYILSGEGVVTIGEKAYQVEPGDFIGYRKGSEAHTMENTGNQVLRCLVIGERLAHDVADYPRKQKRIYRNSGMEWNLVNHEEILAPKAGEK